MSRIDPTNAPAWIRRMLEEAMRADGAHIRAEVRAAPGNGGATIIALGEGTFAAPLPEAWSYHPASLFDGRLRIKEGYDVHYRIDSHEDPEAAAGGPALLRYANEPEFKDAVETPDDILKDFLISVPAGEDIGKEIVWKCVEPFGGTHVRVLELRCPLLTAELVEHRMSIARAIAEWLNLGRFSPEPTPLDRIAPNPALKRVSLQDRMLMRVPADWTVAITGETEGRKEYAIGDPPDHHTFWAVTDAQPMPSDEFARLYVRIMAQKIMEKAEKETPCPWTENRVWELPDGDILIRQSRQWVSEDGSEDARNVAWYRYAVRDAHFVWAELFLVTPNRFLADDDADRIVELFDREIRSAIMLGPAEQPPLPD